MALVGEKEDLLGPLQEDPCLEAPLLADVTQRRRSGKDPREEDP
jgi:hypothetical protein